MPQQMPEQMSGHMPDGLAMLDPPARPSARDCASREDTLFEDLLDLELEIRALAMPGIASPAGRGLRVAAMVAALPDRLGEVALDGLRADLGLLRAALAGNDAAQAHKAEANLLARLADLRAAIG